MPRTKNLAMGARLSAATGHKPHRLRRTLFRPLRHVGIPVSFAAAVDPCWSIQLAHVAPGATGRVVGGSEWLAQLVWTPL